MAPVDDIASWYSEIQEDKHHQLGTDQKEAPMMAWQTLSHMNAWLAMGLWQVGIWALVIWGIYRLTHHH
ncbi:MAG: hypothetical protein ACYCT0_07130 [Sulfobacillus sp.]